MLSNSCKVFFDLLFLFFFSFFTQSTLGSFIIVDVKDGQGLIYIHSSSNRSPHGSLIQNQRVITNTILFYSFTSALYIIIKIASCQQGLGGGHSYGFTPRGRFSAEYCGQINRSNLPHNPEKSTSRSALAISTTYHWSS